MSSRPPRALAALLLGLAGLLLTGLSVPATAADTTNAAIDHAQPIKGGVRLLVTVPGSDPVDYKNVKATVANSDVPTTAAAASDIADVERTSILAIDTSASMSGQRISEAKKAAVAYLAAVPDNVKVGVVSFDSSVKTDLKPTLDRAAALDAVNGLRLSFQTELYQGVEGALKAAGNKKAQRSILLLSDGKDTTGTSLDDVLTAVHDSGAKVDVVSLQKGSQPRGPLQQIADAGKGSVLTTDDPAALTAAFSKEAAALARQVVVTATLPAGFTGTSSNVTVTVPTASQTYSASAYVPVRSAASVAAAKAAAAAPHPVTAGPLTLSKNVMFGAVGAIGIGLLGLILVLGLGGRKPSANLTLNEQIKAYGVMSVPGQSGPRRDGAPTPFSGQARQAAEKALANNKNLEARLTTALEAAGMQLRPAEWLLMRAGVAVGGGLVGLLLATANIVLGVLVILAALIGPSIYLKFKRSRRLRAFSMGLADTLQLMSGSLSAGLSLAQSIDTIVREGGEPISSEFRRVVIETRLGVTLEDSLEGVAQRMESKDFEWVVMAIRIQREVGGNLAELLLTVAATLRERDYLRRHVKALSAEGRLSCWILGGLPPGFLTYLALSNPTYVKPMYTSTIGWILVSGMTLLLGVGVLWMTKVAKVDI